MKKSVSYFSLTMRPSARSNSVLHTHYNARHRRELARQQQPDTAAKDARQVLVHTRRHTRIVQQLDALRVRQAQRRIQVLHSACARRGRMVRRPRRTAAEATTQARGRTHLQVLERVLRTHSLNFTREALLQLVEDEDEQVREHVQHLVVVLVDHHLEVQAVELTQVPWRTTTATATATARQQAHATRQEGGDD
jgi:hypothetical protein